MIRLGVCFSSAVCLILLSSALLAAAEPAGVQVVAVESGGLAAAAGLQAGDVLLGWTLLREEEAGGRLLTPFDFLEVEEHRSALGRIAFTGRRGDEALEVELPPGDWGVEVRMWMSGLLSREYAAVHERFDEHRDEALAGLRQLARRFSARQHHRVASWLWFELSRLLRRAHPSGEEIEALELALAAAETAAMELDAARIEETQARAFEKLSDLERGLEKAQSALERRQRLDPGGIAVARTHNQIGIFHGMAGEIGAAEEHFTAALEVAERLAPESRLMSACLGNLGIVARKRGDLARAEALLRRDLELTEKREPESLNLALTLHNLGNLAKDRGDLALAQHHHVRALSLRERLAGAEGLELAESLHSLGEIARQRGDLLAAEAFHRRSLAISERLAPEGLDRAITLIALGNVLADQGDPEGAERLYRSGLVLLETLLPGGLEIAASLNSLGHLIAGRGDFETAAPFLVRALAIYEQRVPGTTSVALSLTNLALVRLEQGDLAAAAAALDRAAKIYRTSAPESLYHATVWRAQGLLARARGDLEHAERLFSRALELRQRWAPQSAETAEAAFDLAELRRRQKRSAEALDFYRRAVEALENQHRRLGGDQMARATFDARYAEPYHQFLQLLIEEERLAEAFHLLERYRAKSFLQLLAARDLVWSLDLPPELDRERRMANAVFDQLYARLIAAEDESRRQQLAAQLEDARRERDEIAARIRLASPRLAALQDPRPLDLAAVQRALDPGTLLLSYAVGAEQSFVFALGPGSDELAVFPLGLGGTALTDKALAAEVSRFRVELERGHLDARLQKVRFRARTLGRALLAPVRARLARAERLLIVADGPLHLLPFAALVDPNGERYLIEALPIHHAASVTVFAELDRRTPAASSAVVGFGDPRYPATTPSPPAPALRGWRLTPLPGSRSEIESLRRIFPDRARTYLGAAATETRAKEVDQAAYLHFACHGRYDDRLPLESALALSIPTSWGAEEQNGLLQAWEIFEQVRLEVDLVTLSACESGAGAVLGGEGLVGLSRAFQYAGARAVLASLWKVDDRSTAELMRHVYRELAAGRPKGEALRRGQLELLRTPELAHPFHWAAFRLDGAWR